MSGEMVGWKRYAEVLDEIDRLRARVAELEAERDRLRSDVLALTAWQHAHQEQLNAVTAARDEALSKAPTWKQLVEMRNKQLGEDLDKINDLKADSAKWERAARRLAAFAHDSSGQCRGPSGDPFTTEEWIVYAISTTAPQAQEEEG